MQLPFYALLPIPLTIAAAFAQIVDTATISGVVRDSSGAVIPQARITLLNTDTGIAEKTVTDSGGRYSSRPLHVGEYEVEAEAAGFSRSLTRVRLDVAQHASVDISLAVGQNTETVTVTSSAALLGTETLTLSNLENRTAVTNLPLNGRNFSQLMSLGAGVTPAQSQLTGNLPISEARGPTAYSVNGSRFEENHFLLDGINDNDNHNGYGVIIYPPLDAIEEFRTENSVADARFGRGGGGNVNLIFKSGTRNFHGDVFEFLRNSSLDARNFFDKTIPAFRMNQFGGSIGGPLLSRRDPKTFFFVDYQGTRTSQGLTFVSTVPAAAFRTGDFSAAPQRIYDPTTQAQGTNARQQFPGNIIPVSRIDPVGAALIKLYPSSNQPGIANNFLLNPSLSQTEDKGDVKIDHTFSEYDNGYFRYSHARNEIFTPGPLPAPAVGGGGPTGETNEPSNQVVLSENHTFSPTVVNEARFGLSRLNIRTFNEDYGQDLALQAGIPNSNIPGDKLTSGLPLLSITGATQLGESGLNPAVLVSTDFQWDDDVTLIRGRHTFTFGAEALRLQYNAFQTGNERGTLNFTTQYTANPAAAAGTGLGLADLLLGRPASGGLAYIAGTRGFRQTGLSFYAQDNFKISNRLTLILGVRYENDLGYPWVEVHNRMYNFVAPDHVLQVGTNGIPESGTRGNNHNFMPRVGLAYRLGGKTVVRSGYGIFYSAPPLPVGVYLGSNPPEIISTAFTNDQFNFASALPASAGFSRPPAGVIAGAALNTVDPNLHLPYTEQWNLTIERQLPASLLLTAAYVGSEGVYLNAYPNINQAVPGATPIAQRRPFPLFQGIQSSSDLDTSSYNALQVTAERRLSRGFSFQVAYSLSHALDEDSGNLQQFMDVYNRKLDRGNSGFNVPHHFAASWTYEFPFKSRGALRQVVEGWQLNGILTLFSGLPFSVGSATNTLNTGGSSRATLIGPGNGSLPPDQRTIRAWFNTAAFTAPGLLQYGNAGRDTLQGPATKQLDMSAFKNFPLSADAARRLQFRAEIFNITNTPQFNNPNGSIGSAGVGAITSAGAPYQLQRLSREIQLALKLYF